MIIRGKRDSNVLHSLPTTAGQKSESRSEKLSGRAQVACQAALLLPSLAQHVQNIVDAGSQLYAFGPKAGDAQRRGGRHQHRDEG